MHEIIDVPSNVGAHAAQLANEGVKAVIRYYNHRNSSSLPSKRLTQTELTDLHGAGLAVAVVFQQRGGAGGNIGDLTEASGTNDAEQALRMAADLGQPLGSAIYFAVDWDFFRASELAAITPYFEEASRLVRAQNYKVGVYGSGTVGGHMKARGLVDHIWLAGATGWSGTQQALASGNWTLFQKFLHQTSPLGFGYDGNIANPAMSDYGQFGPQAVVITPRGQGAAAIYRVTARSGLNLRNGPGESFRVSATYPQGTLVTGRGGDGPWIQVDIEGDGDVDGFMHSAFLQAVSGGLPIDAGPSPRPLDVAKAELALDVRELPGAAHNPRIVLYHSTTEGGAASDETAWCSSFVNYCVEQAGLRGTDSKWAMSWHEKGWGSAVPTANAAEGDMVVFRRRDGQANGAILGGHVGFWLGTEGANIRLLGGNQGNRISIAQYPVNGVLAPFHYELLSVRRA